MADKKITVESEADGMTDKQFLNHLCELLELAKRSENLQEFIKTLEKLIAEYRQ